jgi:uncharacterized membrane protein
MKRKITYLLKDLDSMIKSFLTAKDFNSQVELMKNKNFVYAEIDKMIKKYDKIIESIKENTESETENET